MSVMTWNLSETRFYAKMSLSFHFSVNLMMKMSLIHPCVCNKKNLVFTLTAQLQCIFKHVYVNAGAWGLITSVLITSE